jgi:hypothetical protein
MKMKDQVVTISFLCNPQLPQTLIDFHAILTASDHDDTTGEKELYLGEVNILDTVGHMIEMANDHKEAIDMDKEEKQYFETVYAAHQAAMSARGGGKS